MSKLRLGVIQSLDNVTESIRKVREFDLPTCQISAWDPGTYTDDAVRALKKASNDFDVEVTSIWAGYPGKAVWDFVDGPRTIGIVPKETREMRVDALIKGVEFAARCGVASATTHAGFVPENPGDPEYPGVVEALARIAKRAKELGLWFCFETGQETPTTLMRVIRDIGLDNLGVNLDPANLLMYGKANPIDAADIFGSLIKGCHAKDGEYPTDPNKLGHEKPLGEGRVNFPVLVPKLKSYGFSGALTIEREISGPAQIEGIKQAIRVLTPLL